MKRRAWSASLVVTVVFAVTICSTVYAAEHDALKPLLIDLEDWKAEEAEGMSMDMGGTKMVNAFRMYQRDDMELSATIMLGSSSMARSQMQRMGRMETDDMKMEFGQVDSFKVHTAHDKKEKGGYLVILLAEEEERTAMFVLQYSGMDEEDALVLAKQFGWKKMKDEALKLM